MPVEETFGVTDTGKLHIRGFPSLVSRSPTVVANHHPLPTLASDTWNLTPDRLLVLLEFLATPLANKLGRKRCPIGSSCFSAVRLTVTGQSYLRRRHEGRSVLRRSAASLR